MSYRKDPKYNFFLKKGENPSLVLIAGPSTLERSSYLWVPGLSAIMRKGDRLFAARANDPSKWTPKFTHEYNKKSGQWEPYFHIVNPWSECVVTR